MSIEGISEISRREALLLAAGGVAAALTAAPGAARAEAATVSGLVFEDKDGTGKPGPGNPGLAGVLVSNGRDIAVTGADGRYTLPLPEEAAIFVIKPAGFMPPVDPATNLPRSREAWQATRENLSARRHCGRDHRRGARRNARRRPSPDRSACRS